MVDLSQHEEYFKAMRAELDQKESQASAESHQQFADVLAAISQSLKVDLNSFDDMHTIKAEQVDSNIDVLGATLGNIDDEVARSYAVNTLNDAVPDLSSENVRKLFLALPTDTGPVSGAKDALGNALVEKSNNNARELLDLIETSLKEPRDVFALVGRLHEISGDRDRKVALLQKAMQTGQLDWAVADAAKKMKAVELAPQLAARASEIADKDIALYVAEAAERLQY